MRHVVDHKKMKWILFVVRPLFYDLVMTEMIIDLLKMTATMQYIWDFIISQILSGVEACQLKVATYFFGPYPCSPQRAEAILNKISNNINKTYIGLISVLQGFQKCIA